MTKQLNGLFYIPKNTPPSTYVSHSEPFIHSFIYSHSIDHTDVEFVIKYKYKQATIYKYKYNFR